MILRGQGIKGAFNRAVKRAGRRGGVLSEVWRGRVSHRESHRGAHRRAHRDGLFPLESQWVAWIAPVRLTRFVHTAR